MALLASLTTDEEHAYAKSYTSKLQKRETRMLQKR